MAMDAHDIEKLIKDGIPDAKVTIRDLAGDGDHYAAEVVAESFRGKSRIQQHQMVYDALKGNMGGVLHALGAADQRSRLRPFGPTPAWPKPAHPLRHFGHGAANVLFRATYGFI